MKDRDAILTLNAGSSSLKFALYPLDTGNRPTALFRGQISTLDTAPHFTVFDADCRSLVDIDLPLLEPEQATSHLLDWLEQHTVPIHMVAAGHRVVHGGSRFDRPVQIDPQVYEQLQALVPLAPLHMPHNLAAIDFLRRERPGLLQVACFDTAFHRSMPVREQVYALPHEWLTMGVRRYGFHGLSYEYIASVLPQHLGEVADAKVIVAHLGHGASLCAMQKRRSVATTMGFTPLDGIPMATRPGALDPGVVTWLIREAGLTPAAVDDLLNHHSGLLGLSGISGDMRELLQDPRPEAADAIDYFVHHTQRAIASLAGAMGGLDVLVFTAGIGENAPTIRERICREAAWLGIEINPGANAVNGTRISAPDSPVTVWRIPTDEERMIALHTRNTFIAADEGQRA